MGKPIEHTALSKSILKTLLYFDIFHYPLTASEVFRHLPTNHVTQDHVARELDRLSSQSIIYPISDFFSVQNNPALGNRRIKGNLMASHSLLQAQKKALLISRFPFVRAVMASGSLSKNYMDEFSDLDFFVVTKSNRLWISRTLLVLYKKIFYFNSHKYFCINYFVDEEHLEIEEKNIFTATELATLIPLYGKEHYQQLMAANKWLKDYLPNHASRSTENILSCHLNWIQKQLENILNLSWANRVERISMKIISSRWKKLYQSTYSEPDFKIAFKSKEFISKGHPRNHQRKVLDLYNQKLQQFGNKLNINWDE